MNERRAADAQRKAKIIINQSEEEANKRKSLDSNQKPRRK